MPRDATTETSSSVARTVHPAGAPPGAASCAKAEAPGISASISTPSTPAGRGFTRAKAAAALFSTAPISPGRCA